VCCVLCDPVASIMRIPWPTKGFSACNKIFSKENYKSLSFDVRCEGRIDLTL
jgi:hypothetical protein